MKQRKYLCAQIYLMLVTLSLAQNTGRKLGKFEEVFAWRQLTYDIDGRVYDRDVFDEPYNIGNTRDREKRQTDSVFFNNNDDEPDRNWNHRPLMRPPNQAIIASTNRPQSVEENSQPPRGNSGPSATTTTIRPTDEAGRFFVQYNNIPMGVERVGERLFVTVPRRRYGVISTLNFIDLSRDSHTLSPALKPYPNFSVSRRLTSVYRTRADSCGRLWMVDTGMIEIPNNRQQVQPPAIVVFDLNRDRQIFRYQFKSADIPAENTPTGLASITVDITDGDCENAFAYIPDLATYGLIVYSLRDNDSWRLSHNFFSFSPTSGNLNIAGLRFQWSDGIFSLTLVPGRGNCKTAYFHPLIGTQEFSVSTCVLKNRTVSSDPNYWSLFSLLGDRGEGSQATMHDYHPASRVVFIAEIGRDAVSCWNTGEALVSTNIAILAQDSQRLSYPADLHVTGNEVWVIANSLPRFSYSRLDTNSYNFYIYRGNVQELIAGTPCTSYSSSSNYNIQ
ncbi:L-dopachrome tautomerase yellow-f-like isoform X2 [Galleria mellonella]|uniref:L-dopachrome tautomerase yellow-f-like isoform X2 n=1 Tax=Galleria mellonella TaxID=7137 RepID=A0ABM3M9H7_GALME|nr:L-dopachrome tautomerase yellow-f-like isoform X2 [Galleria mellonella]